MIKIIFDKARSITIEDEGENRLSFEGFDAVTRKALTSMFESQGKSVHVSEGDPVEHFVSLFRDVEGIEIIEQPIEPFKESPIDY